MNGTVSIAQARYPSWQHQAALLVKKVGKEFQSLRRDTPHGNYHVQQCATIGLCMFQSLRRDTPHGNSLSEVQTAIYSKLFQSLRRDTPHGNFAAAFCH